MLPGGVLSTNPVISPLLFPKNLTVIGLEAFEIGGSALNDPSDGLLVKPWRAFADDDGDIFIESDDVAATFLLNVPDLFTMSLTFDQNMNPFLAFTDSGGAKFYWFDTFDSQYKITALPAGSSYPRCSLDDKRWFSTGDSDIILSYIRDGNLYYRQQRDRYEVEYLLFADLNQFIIDPRLTEISMGAGNRFIFQTAGAFFPV